MVILGTSVSEQKYQNVLDQIPPQMPKWGKSFQNMLFQNGVNIVVDQTLFYLDSPLWF